VEVSIMQSLRAMRVVVFVLLAMLTAGRVTATTVIPIADEELRDRADVIVHGVVVSSVVEEDTAGRPVTVSVISPLDVVKGRLSGNLVLRQLGGTLSDGRFMQVWGRPEYQPGAEVLVFAVTRPEGDYQTAEMLLGKFEVQTDGVGTHFAVPAMTSPGVTVVGNASTAVVPRELAAFLQFLRQPGTQVPGTSVTPRGALQPVFHPQADGTIGPFPFNLSLLARWNNDKTAAWQLSGQANITGGGSSEAAAATATWNNESNSVINYGIAAGASNVIVMDALSSPCGWNTCITSAGGVIGCATAFGAGTHIWRNETYTTLGGGTVWLRSYCSLNAFDSILTQSVLAHELGHTLGLGHSDQGFSSHDVCIGDENDATMRSFVQHRTTLGTDDSDAVRWLYGDGGASCSGPPPPSVTVSIAATTPSAAEAEPINGVFTVSRTGSTATALTVSYVASGTATPGADYLALSGSLTISAGAATAVLTVIPIDDSLVEGSETVTVTLSASASYTVGSPASATVTIADNDADGPQTLTASPTTIAAGGTVTATWSGIATPTSGDWLGLYVPGTTNTAYLTWRYGTGAASDSVSFQLPAILGAGTYELRLLANKGYTALATSNVLTVPGGAAATLTVSPTMVAAGSAVTATWTGSSSDGDWIGLYIPGTPTTAYLASRYTTGLASDSASFTLPASLAPGTYELRLLANKGYTSLATSNVLTVTGSGGRTAALSASPATVPPGAAVIVTWSGIETPTSGDWIALYVSGTSNNNSFLAWRYTTGAASGSLPLVLPASLAPGSYEVRFLANKGYTSLVLSKGITVPAQ
jgi:Calx-beta domain/Matrixin